MRIAIDLTPLLPGGSNGGAKIMTLQLIKKLSQVAPENQYILLASKKNARELYPLKAKNISIICTSAFSRFTLRNSVIFLTSMGMRLIEKLNILPTAILSRLMRKHHQLCSNFTAKDLSAAIKADLLFCPFTAPFYHRLNIPIVSIIYDLQSYYYPHFFTPEERYERKKNFESACLWAKKLICISDFVKQTVLHNSYVKEDSIKTIHIKSINRLKLADNKKTVTFLNRYGLTENNFLLFPANFWPHKNHQLLFTAFNIYRTQAPDTTLKLVCTGSENHYKHFLQNAVQDMGLSEHIIMPGYLSDENFAIFLASCKAVIYPSLYEGFGMPILEAMAAKKPVLCSSLTSMPEVAGNAALLFDPRKPTEIAEAIYRIQTEQDLIKSLIQRGLEHIVEFENENDMAKEYLQIFRSAIQVAS